MPDGTLRFDTSLNTGGLQDGMGKLGSIAKNALGVFAGNMMTKATDAIVNLGREALNSGMSFEASMAKTKTLFSGTDAEFSALSDELLRISSATGLAADGLAEAAYSAESAGVPMEMLGTMIEKSAELATAGFTDIDTALSATAKTMNAYGMTGEEAIDRVQKVLMQTQNLGITTVGELGASLAQVTPTAASFGVAFEQVGASLAVMTAAGTPTAQATTQLNALIAELGKNGTTAAKNLEKAAQGTEYAGMTFTQMMDAGADLGTVLGMISAEADKNGLTMVDMFSSIEAGKAALAITSQEGETFSSNLAAMSTEADVVGEAFSTVSDTLEFKTQKIQASFSNMATSLFQTVAGPLADAADNAATAVATLTDAFNSGGLSGVADALIVMVENAASQISSFDWAGLGDKIVSGITDFIESDGLGRFLGALTTIFTSVVSGISSMLPSIIPALVELIGYIVTTLLEQLPQLLDCALQLLLGLARGFLNALPVLIAQLPKIILAIVNFIISAIPQLIEAAIQLFMALVDAIPAIITALVGALPQIIESVITCLIAAIPQLLEGAIQLFMALVDAIPTIITALVGALPQIITTIITTLISNIPALLQGAIQLFMAIVQAIPQIITQLVPLIPTIVTSVVETLISNIPALLQGAIQLFMAIVQAIPQIVVELAGAVPDIITGIVNGLIEGIGAVGEAAAQLGQSILNGIKSFLGINSPSTVMEDQGEYIVAGLLNGMEAMPGAIDGLFQSTLDSVTTWGTDLANRVRDWGANLATAARGAMITMLQAALEGVQSLPEDTWVWLVNTTDKIGQWKIRLAQNGSAAAQGLINAVLQGLRDLPASMTAVGADIVTGLWKGIANGWPWLTNMVRQKARELLNAAKKEIEVGSPSKAFRDEMGRWIPPGIGEGVDMAMPDLLNDMRTQARRLVTVMQGEVSASFSDIQVGASGAAALRLGAAGTTVYQDNHMEQYNEYNVPVASPSETSKAQREALRNFLGGVK